MTQNLLQYEETDTTGKYWLKWKSGDWASLPVGFRVYGQRHLAEHLEASIAYQDLLYDLICKEWMLAWFNFEEQYAGFLRDIDRAWHKAEREANIALQIKYALCNSSVAALSTKIPPNLLAASLKYGQLSPSQCIQWIQSNYDDQQKAQTLSAIAPFLPQEHMRDATRIAQALKDYRPIYSILADYPRKYAIEALAPYIPQDLFPELWNATIKSQYFGSMLEKMLPFYPKHLLEDAFQSLCTNFEGKALADLLTQIVPYLPNDVLDESYHCLASSNDPFRNHILSALLPKLSTSSLSHAVNEIFDSVAPELEHNGTILLKLFPYLSPHQQTNAIEHILDKFAEANVVYKNNVLAQVYWKDLMVGLSSYLSKQQAEKARQIAIKLEEHSFSASILIALIPQLPENLHKAIVEEAFARVDKMDDSGSWWNILDKMLAMIPNGLESTTIKALQNTKRDAWDRVSIISLLSKYFMHTNSDEILSLTQGIWYPKMKIMAYLELLPYLSGKKQYEAANSALWYIPLVVFEPEEKLRLQIRLLPYLPQEERTKAISSILPKNDVASLAKFDVAPILLTEFSAYLPIEQRQSVLRHAITQYKIKRSQFLEHVQLEQMMPYVVPYLPDEMLDLLLSKMDEYDRVRALNEFAKHLPKNAVGKTWTALQKIGDQNEISNLISHLLKSGNSVTIDPNSNNIAEIHQYITEQEYRSTLTDAAEEDTALNRSGEFMHHTAAAIAKMAPLLPPHLLLDAYEKCCQLADVAEDRNTALAGVIGYLPEDKLSDALIMACASESSTRQYVFQKAQPALALLMRHHPISAHTIFSKMLRTLAPIPRRYFLADIACLLPFVQLLIRSIDESKPDINSEISQVVREIQEWWT